MQVKPWVFVVLVGCGSGKLAPGELIGGRVPRIDRVELTAIPTAADKLPPLLFVEPDGTYATSANHPATWETLASFAPGALTPTALDPVKDWSDDPPAPEPDPGNDGAEESGGTGTYVTLDEGKMKKDAERAVGQYKMTRSENVWSKRGVRPPSFAGHHSKFGPAGGAEAPERLTTIAGTVAEDRRLIARQSRLIVASPRAKATAVVAAVEHTGGSILVAVGGDVKPLRLQFASTVPAMESRVAKWIEVRVTATDLAIEVVPDIPTPVKQLSDLAPSYQPLAKKYPEAVVDVLVGSDVDTQRLIDVLAALDLAGARTIALGPAPAVADPLRDRRILAFSIGQPTANGDLPKADIKQVVRDARPLLRACYEAALATNPELAGTVMVQFFIDPTGKVAVSNGSGVPEVAPCIAKAIGALVFPKPKGGGGVQVNFPFSLRPTL